MADVAENLNWVVVGLGSNLEKERNMPASIHHLHQKTTVLAVSPLYETIGVGNGEDAPNFYNAAVLIETPLNAVALKNEVLQPIEQALGRTADKNVPHPIDMDIYLFNGDIFYYEGRHIPHPDLLKYAHAIVPVADLLPDFLHPETGERLQDIAERLMRGAEGKIWRVLVA